MDAMMVDISIPQWQGYVHRDWRDELLSDCPLAWCLRQDGQVVHERAQAQTTRIAGRDGRPTLYFKRFADGKRRWLGRRPLYRMVHVTQAMRQAGLRVPQIIFAGYRRSDTGWEGLVIQEGAAGRPVSHLIAGEVDSRESEKLLINVGRRIAELHTRRFLHGDLLPGNVLMESSDGELIFIDNDRTRWMPVLPLWLRRRNLRQFTLRCMAQLPWRETRLMLDSYFDAIGLDASRRRREMCRIIQRSREKLPRLYDRKGETRGLVLSRLRAARATQVAAAVGMTLAVVPVAAV